MAVNTAYIHSLISQGEGLEVEFKESYASLSRSVFDTICAFMNRNGGHILLGVDNYLAFRNKSTNFAI